jgi:uncharacterized protein YheU (UPF0270 family)
LLIHYQQQFQERANELIEELLTRHFTQLVQLARIAERDATSLTHQLQQVAEVFDESK